MRDDVIFEVMKDHLETGIRGFPVGYCPTSYFDPKKGLFYVGRPISQLLHFSLIDVIYLLYHGEDATDAQIEAFEKEIKSRMSLSKELENEIKMLPKHLDPMDLFAMSLLLLKHFEKTNNYREDCWNLIAKLPLLLISVINHHQGNEKSIDIDQANSYLDNLVKNLGCQNAHFSEFLHLYMLLHLDQGGGDLPSFIGKVAASSKQDLYTSVASSVLSFQGERYGKAIKNAFSFIKSVSGLSEQEIKQKMKEYIEQGKIFPGFGHAILKIEDPRTQILFDFAEKHFSLHPLIKASLHIRNVGTRLFENKLSCPYANTDLISGALFAACTWEHSEYFPLIQAFAKMIGTSIQIVYDQVEARSGKGIPMIMPKYFFKAKNPVAFPK